MPQDSPIPQGFRVLVIVARPLDLQDLPNIADQWSLLGGLRRVNAPAHLKVLRPPTVEGLRAEILSGYDIVHFDGHGSFGVRCPNCGGLNQPEQKECSRCECLLDGEKAKGYFAFEREDGKLDSLAAEELAEIVMSAPEHPTKLVFLSACESAKGGDASLQSVLLAKGVPAVLGMNEPVTAKATMTLAAPFYASLGAGMTIARAFETALPALKRLENGSELQKIPVLEGPGKDVKILIAKVAGRASFEAEPLFGVPEYEFVGDYIRGDPPHGRKAILSQAMDELLGGEKLVVLTGQGGIGKTVLAAEAARRLSWHYPGGIFWRSAADMELLGLNELLDAFAVVLGWEFRTLPLDAKRDRVLNYLRNYDTASLLVLDNSEKIKDANLWRFLEGIPQPSAALVTTRESLSCGGLEIRVPEMMMGEAGRLLITEASRRSPKWGTQLSQADLESLNEIASFMQGHPLAIKLTAALIASRSLTGIRDELRLNPPQKISERFDVSYGSLKEGQRDLFCCLAVFSGSMTEEAVGSICIEGDQKGSWNWQSDLGELERRSFLDRIEIEAQDESGDEVTLYRYRLHPLIRQYAAGKAGEELLARLRPRAAKYFLKYAQDYRNNFDMLEWERENILIGMDWAVARAASSLILQFMAALYNYLDTRGYWNEYQLRLHQAKNAAKVLKKGNEEARCIHNLGIIASKQGNYIEAKKLFKQSEEISKENGDNSNIPKLRHEEGILAYRKSEYNEARRLFQQSLEIAKERRDYGVVSKSLHWLGIMARDSRDYDEAGRLFQQSLEIARDLDDKSDVSKLLGDMGILAEASSDYDEARQLFQQSLEIAQELGDKNDISTLQYELGILSCLEKNFDEARGLFQKSLEISQELDDKSGIAYSRTQIALLEEKRGNVKEALRLIRQAEAAFLDLGSPCTKFAEEVRQRLEQN